MAREKNSQLDVTGLLVFQKRTGEFLQILEGEKVVVLNLLKTIAHLSFHARRGIMDQSLVFRDSLVGKSGSGFLFILFQPLSAMGHHFPHQFSWAKQ